MAKTGTGSDYLADGSFDWSGGVDSSKPTTIQSALNPNGLARNQLAWLFNGSVRGGSILQRTGWQPLTHLLQGGGRWQGGFMYEPDSGNPYLVYSVSGRILAALLDPPYTITDLSASFGLFNPPDAEMAFFVQGENYLIIQAGDFNTGPFNITVNSYGQALVAPSSTLPLFWDGTTLRRSRGITTAWAANLGPNLNEIPAATCMWYHASRIWYAQNRAVNAGDIVGSHVSGTAPNHYRDSILEVTESPLVVGGDGFSVPTHAGNIRALREEVNLNESVSQSRLLIWTRSAVFGLIVPVTRADWIATTGLNQPAIVPVQKVNGSVGDRCVVASNGDWFYQSFEPGIRSLITAQRLFASWSNTPISQAVKRGLELNDRALMRFSSGIVFDNRMLQLILPEISGDSVNVVHRGMLPLDFNVVTSLDSASKPVWEGAYDGLPFLQVFTGDFGGLPRAFGAVLSDVDGSIDIWELTTASRTEGGDNRLVWGIEFPAFTWSGQGLEFKIKQLMGAEIWVDKLFGTVDMDISYREDADPCWRFWHHAQICVARNCEEKPEPACLGYPYPQVPFREGYRFPVVLPEPKGPCDSMGIRPTTTAYQFQVRIIFKGWCRVRGLILYAIPREKPQYQGVICQPNITQDGMYKLPKLPWNYQTNPPTPPPVVPTLVILEDSLGFFWKVISDSDCNIGCQSDPGPKTPDVILVDGSGAFWKMIVNTDGLRGAESHAGPATLPPIIPNGLGGNCQLVVDTDGNIGAMSV